ncbi:MAG: hypothetical protein MSG64_13565 [Pyrinomonadaceae bacterium MAG19_C2-C3]|nr:hypothetical protein [Pyrinomonadaceae bacterium MAG19_C2-C3]
MSKNQSAATGEACAMNVKAVWEFTRDPMRLTIPLFTSGVSAGFPSPAEDWIEGKLDFNCWLIDHPAATFIALPRRICLQESGRNAQRLFCRQMNLQGECSIKIHGRSYDASRRRWIKSTKSTDAILCVMDLWKHPVGGRRSGEARATQPIGASWQSSEDR